MKFIADFHIHSHYSLATSKLLTPEHLDYWADLKGINVVGTGDCIHPGWHSELKEKLESSGDGLFDLKEEYKLKDSERQANFSDCRPVKFILTAEISCIYKKSGKIRKVHNLLMFPDFESAGKFQNKLDRLGNIRSDGRPILGLDSKKLYEIALEINENITLIPAHIWTPWFSALGSKSGFNTIEECYEDLTKYIYAVETGLSSDPDMNRYCGFLDRFALISNSDAHSPDKLGREANLFDGEFSYEGILSALKQSGSKCKFNGTIEFFPQEGKYHLDGHRKCGICWEPSETLKNKGICPKCGKQVTLGVLYRVMELADKTYEQMKKNTPDFFSIIPLREILGEIAGTASVSKKVNSEYFRLLSKLGPEFDILLNIDADEIKKRANEILAEGIKRLRERKVILNNGYDGEYGVIKVFEPSEIKKLTQNSFGFDWTKNSKTQTDKSAGNSFEEFKSKLKSLKKNETEITPEKISGKAPNKEQISGIEFFQGQCLIISGPGSGKTFVLTERIIQLVKNKNAEPSRILALTFSNKAADEIKIRIKGKITRSEDVFVSTFHSFGLKILKTYFETKTKDSGFTVIDFETAENILKLLPDVPKKQIKSVLKTISLMKQGAGLENGDELKAVFREYQQKLELLNMVDIDDLVYKTVEILNADSEFREKIIGLFDWILIDEFQDINAKQYDLIKLIGGKKPNLFAIGDPDQSIYGFRGSDVRFIKRFAEDYAESKTINLKISYRCPEVIIKAGSQILNRNEYMSGLKCGVKISIRQCETEASEADWIARQIENMSGGLRHFSIDSSVADGSEYEDITSLGDFAVICRTSLIFVALKTAFKNYSIPYQITGEIPFFKNEPFSAVLDFFNYLIKKKELEFAENKFDFNFEMLYLTNKNKDAMKNLISGGKKIESLIFENRNVPEILEYMFKLIDIDERENFSNITSLMEYGKKFKNDYSGFCSNMSINGPVDFFKSESEKVSIMTLHSSKGLEFKTVFIPACEEGLIPFELFGKKTEDEIEEEKRLFYVGVTRTAKYLFLTHSKKRAIKGRLYCRNRSRFIDNIEKELFESGVRLKKRNPKIENLELPL